MKSVLRLIGSAVAGIALAGAAMAQEPIRIALVHGISGHALEAFSKQSHTGFELGLEYATDGTNMVRGRPVELIVKDTQFKPDVARAVLAEAYGDDEVLLAVGATSSGVTKGLLPIAEEYERILLVEPAVADSLTGPDSNRYVFKTSRNSSMDMQAQAIALQPDKDLFVATIAEDYAFGRDGIEAFKAALEGTGATVVTEEYVPQGTTDFTAPAERMFNVLKDREGRKVIFIYIAGGGDPIGKIPGHAARPLRHRALDRRPHPSGAADLQEGAGNGRGDLLLLREPRERDQRLAREYPHGALRHPARLLHCRRHGGRPGRGQGTGDSRRA